MKINKTLTIIAAVYLVVNCLFYLHASSLNGGSSMGYLFVFPAFWIATLLLVTVLSIRYRKLWFKKELLLSTLIAIVLCTPIPVNIIFQGTRPEIYLSASGYDNGVKNYESWNYANGNRAAVKFWKNSAKGGTWVYFDKNGDTTKTEFYKDGTLIKTKVYKEK